VETVVPPNVVGPGDGRGQYGRQVISLWTVVNSRRSHKTQVGLSAPAAAVPLVRRTETTDGDSVL